MRKGYAFPAIFQSATLEISPLKVNRPSDPAVCPQKSNAQNSVQSLDNVDITIYDSDPSKRVEYRGLIRFTILGSTVAVKVP